MSPYAYSIRAAWTSHARATVKCVDCNNEILLMHAPRKPFRHWCLRCDKPTLHNNTGLVSQHTLPPKEQDDVTQKEHNRAYQREYSRRRRARNRAT